MVTIMELTDLEGKNVKTGKVSQALSLFWQELKHLQDIEAAPEG
jgi:hypothetical protein